MRKLTQPFGYTYCDRGDHPGDDAEARDWCERYHRDWRPRRVVPDPLPRWGEMFPEGRHIFYEGDDPTGFVHTVKAEFDFDPSVDDSWSELCAGEPMRMFWCPPEHLDAIYGSGRWPMGS